MRKCSRYASRIEQTAYWLLAIMPFAMVIANRSATAIITLAGLLAFSGRMLGGYRLQGLLTLSSKSIAAFLFICWAALTISWSHAPATSLFVFAEACLPFIGGILLLASLPREVPKNILLAAVFSFAASCLLIIIELKLGLITREVIGHRAHSSIFNRPVMTLLLIFWPLAIHMNQIGWRWGAFVLACMLVATIIAATSGASMLGALLSFPAFLIALWDRRIGMVVASAMLAGCLLIAPFKGYVLEQLIPPSLVKRLEPVHASDRIIIWQDFAAVLSTHPITGAGFGTSSKMAEAPFIDKIPTERQQLLAVGHPHDGFLQIWVELGLIGALLAAINGFFLLREMPRLQNPMTAAAIASTVAGAIVVSVFHGAWQGWWIGLLMATAVWCTRAVCVQTSSPH